MNQLFYQFLFFIITSLSISVILIHFSGTFFSFACFINCLTFSKKCSKSVFCEIIENSRFTLPILFRFYKSFSFSTSRFSSSFILSIFISSCLSFSSWVFFFLFLLLFLLGLKFFLYVKVKKGRFFYNNFETASVLSIYHDLSVKIINSSGFLYNGGNEFMLMLILKC